ncbi:MAG: DUF4175 family protein [Puniceicoccaceae bacterium]|nr:MAG: DUF4175 family protein [Puniceicoccaceae bacterium]
MTNNRLRPTLERAARTLAQRALAFEAAAGLIVLCLLSLAAALLNRWSPLQEAAAFGFHAAAGACFLVWMSWRALLHLRRPAGPDELAARLERTHPEWMDAFACAVELEGRDPARLRSLERAVVEKARVELGGRDFTSELLPPRLRTPALLVAAGAVLLLALPAFFNDGARKARYHAGDLLAGRSGGIEVRPGSAEVPRAGDLTIQADILRWEREARIDYYEDGERHTYPMNPAGDGELRFTLFELNEGTRYRVVTPSLRSRWYSVDTYTPPALEEYRLQAEPPAYTGQPVVSQSSPEDLRVPDGSTLRWTVRPGPGVTVALETESGKIPFRVEADEPARLAWMPEVSQDWRLVLTDDAGRQVRTPPHRVELIPDHPPTVEITSPARDLTLTPEGVLAIEGQAQDDYGLTRVSLVISKSGRERTYRVIWPGGSGPPEELPLRLRPRTTLDLESLGASPGDVISYFFTATDNRRPNPQTARSEIYFIEVREEPEIVEQDGAPMEEEEIDLRALVVELKRLIRLTWETVGASEERAERLREELEMALAELRLETIRRTADIAERTGLPEDHPLIAILNRAAERIGAASRLAGLGMVEDSLDPQEQALADFVAIENELNREQTRSREPQEGTGSGEGADPGEESTAEAEAMEEMRQTAEALRRMADAQAARNAAASRQEGRASDPELEAELAQRQRDLAAEANALRRRLDRLPGAEPSSLSVDSAAQTMERAAGRLARGDPGAAARDGERARTDLLQALSHLETMMRQQLSQALNRLAEQAGDLAGQQAAQAGESRGLAEDPEAAAGADAAGMRGAQRGLAQDYEDLLRQAADMALALGEEHPETAQALRAALAAAREADPSADMTRAANALLYRRFDRAADSQDAAAEQLAAFGENLGRAVDTLPAFSREELVALMEQIRQARRELQEGGEPGGEMQGLGRELERIGNAIREPGLTEIGGALGDPDQTADLDARRMDTLLQAAARSLENLLMSAEFRRQLELRRASAIPPEAYRDLIESYFRNLGEADTN